MEEDLLSLFSKEVISVFHTDDIEKRECHDICVGRFCDWNGKFLDDYNASREYSRIFMVLESPHVEEYASEPILPARGKTGTRIMRNWQSIFGDRLDAVPLILVNALKYQCSQGLSTKDGRKNRVFGDLMQCKGFQEDLVSRITGFEFDADSDVMINACTRGKPSGQTKRNDELVQDVLEELVSGDRMLNLYHPCTWWCKCRVRDMANRVHYYMQHNTIFVETM